MIKVREQICTTIVQSQKLMELGLSEDTADLYITMKKNRIATISMTKGKDGFPSWSLSKLVEIMKAYPTPHPEVWFDIHFFDEVYNEVCYALINDCCAEYWSDEKRMNVRKGINKWCKAADKIRKSLPTVFQCKNLNRKQLIEFFDHEGSRHRDNRLGRIYRTAAKELKKYEESIKKPNLMLSWSRNVYGYHHVSAWAMNDKGEVCYEYAVATGVSKLSAYWNLAKQMYSLGYLSLFRNVVKQEVKSDIKGRVKHFKVDKVTDTFFLIRQRHTLFFFLHWYDSGAELLCPYYRQSSQLEAVEFIKNAAKEKEFDYRIHIK